MSLYVRYPSVLGIDSRLQQAQNTPPFGLVRYRPTVGDMIEESYIGTIPTSPAIALSPFEEGNCSCRRARYRHIIIRPEHLQKPHLAVIRGAVISSVCFMLVSFFSNYLCIFVR